MASKEKEYVDVLIDRKQYSIVCADSKEEEQIQRVVSIINHKLDMLRGIPDFERSSQEIRTLTVYMELAADILDGRIENEELLSRKERNESELYSLRHDLAAARVRQEELEKQFSHVQTDLQKQQEQCSELQIKVGQYERGGLNEKTQAQLDEWRALSESRQNQLEEWKAQNNELQMQLECCQAQADEQRAQLEQRDTAIFYLKEEQQRALDALHEETVRLQSRMEQINEEKQKQEKEWRRKLDEKNAELNQNTNEKMNLEIEVEELRSDMDAKIKVETDRIRAKEKEKTKTMQKTLNDVQNVCRQLRQEKQETVQSYERRMNLIKTGWEKRLAETEKKHQAEITKLQKQHSEELAKLQGQSEAAVAHVDKKE